MEPYYPAGHASQGVERGERGQPPQQHQQQQLHPVSVLNEDEGIGSTRRPLPRRKGRIHQRKAQGRMLQIQKKLEQHAHVLKAHRQAVRQNKEKERGLESFLMYGYRQ